MEVRQNMDGIGMIPGLACLYMMKMVSWKDITYLVQEY